MNHPNPLQISLALSEVGVYISDQKWNEAMELANAYRDQAEAERIAYGERLEVEIMEIRKGAKK